MKEIVRLINIVLFPWILKYWTAYCLMDFLFPKCRAVDGWGTVEYVRGFGIYLNEFIAIYGIGIAGYVGVFFYAPKLVDGLKKKCLRE